MTNKYDMGVRRLRRRASRGDVADVGRDSQAKICLVLDKRLGGALTLIVTEGPKLFKKHGVKDMIELSWVPLTTACSTVVYLVRPEIDNMKMVGCIFLFPLSLCLLMAKHT